MTLIKLVLHVWYIHAYSWHFDDHFKWSAISVALLVTEIHKNSAKMENVVKNLLEAPPGAMISALRLY